MQDVSGLDAPGFGDETVVVNNGATGTPTISGVAQVGGMLTADVSAIRDADGLPSGFDYRWVRIASGGGKTDIGTNMSRYSPGYADVGSTIGVEVSFTDGKGYPEGPLASVAVGPVTAPATAACPRGQRLGSGADAGVRVRSDIGSARSEVRLCLQYEFRRPRPGHDPLRAGLHRYANHS